VTRQGSVFERLRARGEELFNQVSNELMTNPHFIKAMQGALRGKEKFDQAASRALKNMNIPTRTEFKRALQRIEALEQELAAVRAAPARPARKRKAKAKPSKSKAGEGRSSE